MRTLCSHHLFRPLLLLLCAGAGCAAAGSGGTAGLPDAAVSGTLAYRERIALFPNAIARVRLIESGGSSGADRLVADTVLPELSGVPVPFTLGYSKGEIAEGRSYRIEAEFLEPFGRVIWSGERPVDLSAGETADILLRYAADDREPMRTTYFYRCQGLDIIVRVRGGEIGVIFPDTTYVLSQVPSASGARFSEGDVVFWTKGDEALLELNGVTYRECRSDPARAVWEDFRLRGARFRAVGNEPGWSLVVYDDPVRIDLEVDYGERQLSFSEIATSVAADGRVEYEGWGEGHKVSATVRPEPCADAMSGEAFDRSVTLLLDGREYHGCGRYLK